VQLLSHESYVDATDTYRFRITPHHFRAESIKVLLAHILHVGKLLGAETVAVLVLGSREVAQDSVCEQHKSAASDHDQQDDSPVLHGELSENEGFLLPRFFRYGIW
jgi:hypothetical protein